MQTNTSNVLRGLFCLGAFLLLTATSLRAQSNKVSGTVSGANRKGMPGVTVVVKGANKGTSTDQAGAYSIDVAPGNSLVFSFVGYEPQEVAVNGQTTLNVTLTETTARLDEVIVTAENRSVSAQRVPITMDLVTGKTLLRQGVTDVVQLQNLAPGLNIVQNTVFNQINIRGIGSNDGSAELSDQAVTVGIDGEYINRPVALNAAMFDLDRVEVLKGPQGTLYGRNSSAGAINIIARKPTQTKEADLSATYGNYNTLKLQGAVNLPLGKIAAIRVAGLLSRHDGYRDGGPAGRIDNGNYWATRVGFSLNPSSALSVYIAGEYNQTDQLSPSQYGVALTNVESVRGKAPADYQTTLPNDFNVATAGFLKIDQGAVRTKVAYDFGKALLSYTGGYRVVSLNSYQPLNGFLPETFSFDNNLDYQTQSHELRINGESEKFVWQAGLFYGNERQDVARGLFLPGSAGAFGGKAPYLSFFLRDIISTTTAVFAQATYNFTEKFSLTAGLRNTTDDKTRTGADIASAPFAPRATVFTYPNRPTSTTQTGMRALTGVPNEGNWNQTTWLVGMDYKIDNNRMLFAKVSTGYKAGGFDNIGNYDPENLTAVEIGTKNKFAANRLRLNASAFFYDYSNQQVSVFISTAVGNAIQNAGSTQVTGVELDGEFAATKKDRFRFTVNYLDASFGDFSTVRNRVGGTAEVVNLKGNTPIQAPKWTLVGGYNHDFALGKGTLTAGIQTLFKSDYYMTPFNFVMDKQVAYTKTDLNVTYSANSGKWDLGVFAQNLEDNRILAYSGFTGATVNIYNWIFGAPRTVGIQANVRF